MKKIKSLLSVLCLSMVLTGCSSKSSVKEAQIGGTEEFKNLLTYEIVRLETTNNIQASQPGNSSYYKTNDPSKVFLNLVIKVTNTTTSDLQTNNVFDDTSFVVGEATLKAEVYTEEDSMTTISSYGSIQPNETTYVHLATEVEESAVPENVAINLSINGKVEKLNLNRNALKEQVTTLKKGETLTKNNLYEITYINVNFKMYTFDYLRMYKI